MELEFLLGAGDVGNCTSVQIGKTGLLIDAGGHVGRDISAEKRYPPYMPGRVDHILWTHGHLDHIMWTPIVTKAFAGQRKRPKADILCAVPTPQLAEHNFRDELAIASRGSEDPEEAEGMLGWNEGDLLQCMRRISACPYNQWVGLGNDARAAFMPAGHILGASSVVVQAEGKTVVFSGDVCLEAQKTVGGADWSFLKREGVHVNVLVDESTYGGRPLPPKKVAWREFNEQLLATLQGGGTMMIPAFSIGRAQEVLVGAIECLIANKFRVPVIVDGGARAITRIYEACGAIPDFVRAYHGLHFITEEKGKARMDRDSVIDQYGPRVVISPSGMMNGGAIWAYIERLGGDPKNHIMQVGYQAPGTPGKMLFDCRDKLPQLIAYPGPRGRNWHTTINCQISRVELSAHAPGEHLEILAAEANPETVIVTHGDRENADALVERLKDRFPDIWAAEEGESVTI